MFPASDVVIGATDRDATVRFFGVLGFTERVDAGDETRLLAPRASTAGIVVVPAAGSSIRRTAYDLGPGAIDVYTSDIEAGAARLADAGYEVGPIADLSLGPVDLTQVRVFGPDDVPVVLVASSHRRSSLLDHDANRLFSEGHSLVWVVADRDAEAGWWVDQGASKGMDLDFEVAGVSELLALPDPLVSVRMTMLSDPDVRPFRLELLEFVGLRGAASSVTEVGIIGLRCGTGAGALRVSPGGVRYTI